jgi:hypothetical protein
MPLVSIYSDLLSIPNHYSPGHVCSALDAKILNTLWLETIEQKLETKLKFYTSHDPDEIKSIVEETVHSCQDISSSKLDPCWNAAVEMAGELIINKLMAEDLPLPKDLRWHAEELLKSNPQILARAQAQAVAKNQVAKEMMMRVRS